MKARFGLSIAAVLAAVLALHSCPPLSQPAEANPNAFAQVQWGVPNDYLEYLAAHFDFIYQQPFDYELSVEQLQKLHEMNPRVRITKYRSAPELFNVSSDSTPWDPDDSSPSFDDPDYWSKDFALRQNTEAEWFDIWANHQDWFLRNGAGNYINRKPGSEIGGKRAYLMNPGNDGWRTFVADKGQSFVDKGFDGVWLDLVTTRYWIGWDSHPISPRTGMPYTDAEWRSDLIALVEKVKQKLGSKLVIFNGIFNGDQYESDPALENANADGQMIEGFAPFSQDGFSSESSWRKNIDLLAKLSSLSRPNPYLVFVHAYGEGTYASILGQSFEELARYATASYLLGKNGNSTLFHISFGPSYPTNTGLPSYWEKDMSLYHLQIGDPLGDYYYENNLYQRDFTNGKAVVNPTDTGQSHRLLLGGWYQDPDGKVANAVTLPPKTGIILVKRP